MARGKLFSGFRMLNPCRLRDENCRGGSHLFKSKFSKNTVSLCDYHFRECSEISDQMEMARQKPRFKVRTHFGRSEVNLYDQVFSRSEGLSALVQVEVDKRLDALMQSHKIEDGSEGDDLPVSM